MGKQLKMIEENIELEPHELHGIYTSRQFFEKYVTTYGSHNKKQDALEIEGMYFWVSGVQQSNGHSLQRNQLPIEVVVVLDKYGQPKFRKLDKKGNSAKEISIYDNAGNGLNICETKRQAQYMYNKDLEKAIAVMDDRIKELEGVKGRLFTLELDLDN